MFKRIKELFFPSKESESLDEFVRRVREKRCREITLDPTVIFDGCTYDCARHSYVSGDVQWVIHITAKSDEMVVATHVMRLATQPIRQYNEGAESYKKAYIAAIAIAKRIAEELQKEFPKAIFFVMGPIGNNVLTRPLCFEEVCRIAAR